MELELDAHATRVLGALIEKSLTTPDYYPLSLAALVSACNQKSSRDPVMSLSEGDVREALDRLIHDHLVRERSSAGARVSKFAHRLDDELDEDTPDIAILIDISVSMLRSLQHNRPWAIPQAQLEQMQISQADASAVFERLADQLPQIDELAQALFN